MPYAVVSDLHCHSWSTYGRTNAAGVSSRLEIILGELWRAAEAVVAAGGTILVIAGDIFHVRGSIDPEVLNPVQTMIRRIMDELGVTVLMIPGNHDLKGKETTELGSAIQTLSETFSAEGSIRVFNAPQIVGTGGQSLGFVPWRSKVDDLLKDLEEMARKCNPSEVDVFIHAGIDGVLSGVPAHGLPASRLASIGFRRIFAGHYHNHRDMGAGVFSIGALTHQTWSDVGTDAGYCLVEDDGTVRFHSSKAPKFIDVTGMDEATMERSAAGNYVRFRGGAMKDEDVRELRDFFVKAGAQGVSIQATKQTAVARAGTVGRSGMTLDQSVDNFVAVDKRIPAHVDRDAVKRIAAEVLSTVRSVATA